MQQGFGLRWRSLRQGDGKTALPVGPRAARLRRWALPVLALGLVLAGGVARAEAIVAARYAEPVQRYGHFALGRPHEYARLAATTDDGRQLGFELPPDEVFEDLEPRIVRLAANEPERLLTIVSSRHAGARLVLFERRGDRLRIAAQSAPIGTPMRWLNPVGVADLDADGQAEIAAVVTPHIQGTLKVWRRSGVRLVEVATLADFSNHQYGSAELGLSTPIGIDGRMALVVPDAARGRLRVVALDGNRLVQIGQCALSEPLQARLVPQPAARIELVASADGARRTIDLKTCQPP